MTIREQVTFAFRVERSYRNGKVSTQFMSDVMHSMPVAADLAQYSFCSRTRPISNASNKLRRFLQQ